MAGNVSAFMGQDCRNQAVRKSFQQAGSHHDKGIAVAIGIRIRNVIQFKIQFRYGDSQLFADGRKHIGILFHLVVSQADPG